MLTQSMFSFSLCESMVRSVDSVNMPNSDQETKTGTCTQINIMYKREKLQGLLQSCTWKLHHGE